MTLFAPDDVIELGPVRLRAERVRGESGQLDRGGTGGRRAGTMLADELGRVGVPDEGAAALTEALDEADARVEYVLPLTDLAALAAGTGGLRAGPEAPHLILEVEAPAEGYAQVILEVDSSGLVRWHVPELVPPGGPAAVRAGAEQTFRVPVEQVEAPQSGALARGIAGFGLAKVLHVLRFPIDAAIRTAASPMVGWWEEHNRPYGLAAISAETLRRPIDGRTLSAEEWRRLDGRPTLLLLHGTFSRARSAFHGLAAERTLLTELCRRYEDRVLAFDHPTLHVSPQDNAARLLAGMPNGIELTFDVLAHSRGGLVARHLADLAATSGEPNPRPKVRTTVHVATPNAGTALASPARIGEFLDTFTNLLLLAPDGPVTVSISGIIAVVRQLAMGVVAGLDGLAAMDPDHRDLRRLNAVPAAPGTLAVASDFQPAAASALRLLDHLVDAFFEAANDLVVPTDSVAGTGAFTVTDIFTVPTSQAVAHTTFFQDASVRDKLAARLRG